MLMKATAAPSPHRESARILIEKIRALRDDIPRFTVEGLADGRSNTAGLVPDKFVESASAAMENNPRLVLQASDPATLRDAYDYALAHDPAVQELKALTQFLEHTIRVQRNAAGIVALDTYSNAKRLARRRDGAELKPFVDDMRDKLRKRARPRKTDSAPDPATAPVTPAPPTKV